MTEAAALPLFPHRHLLGISHLSPDDIELLLDRADPSTRARMADLNERLKLPRGATPVVGIADDDPQLAAAFLWAAGPAFEVHGAPPRMLRRLYRTLPRSALFDGGRVIATWTGFPSDAVLDRLARGDLP